MAANGEGLGCMEPWDFFWSKTTAELLDEHRSTPAGLTSVEAAQRLDAFGKNVIRDQKRAGAARLFLKQFTSPIVLLLIAAALLSAFLHDAADALIILVIVSISGALGFFQEHKASRAVAELLAMVQIDAQVFRDAKEISVPLEKIVPGDVVVLNAGDLVPGDGRILDSKGLFVDEAALTGESDPIEKRADVLPGETALSHRANCVWMGTHIISGFAKVLIVNTGRKTVFGAISQKLKLRPPETEFERGVRHFGYLLLEITFLLILAIFAFNVYLQRPVIDSFLFALALAVGLTPQLLPAIISVNLAHGARRMAEQKVIVKRLAAIENFGSMDVLCSDKTGTLTEGKICFEAALDIAGNPSARVLELAVVNASLQSAYTNPMDAAIGERGKTLDLSAWRKLDELPYDFARRRVSVLVENKTRIGARDIITKGAFANVLNICTHAAMPDGALEQMETHRLALRSRFEQLSGEGFRVLALARRDLPVDVLDNSNESGMCFAGFLLFKDPLRVDAKDALKNLNTLGVSVKIITGDAALLAARVAEAAGIQNPRVLTGTELQTISEQALIHRVAKTNVFAEVEPNQKERIILALRKAGHVVGYMGDGINDAPALHAADVGISVSNAVDAAKETADIVLLEKDLAVLERGVRDGRATFANTLKYVFMATSANFGNMFSMAGASLFLPFLPLLPKQILLANLLTDFPEMTIATDRVDREWIEKPRRWDLKFIRRFMLVFGLLSSVFDYITFGVLLVFFRAGVAQFRTGWFVESVVSASIIVLVVRTRRFCARSRPSRALFSTTLLVSVATLLLPFTPLAKRLGLAPLPWQLLVTLLGIVAIYVAVAEMAKKIFWRRSNLHGATRSI